MSGSANVQVESANGRLAEISKCLSQQMSMPSQLKSRQQKSVSKSPVGKCQIGKIPHTTLLTFVFQRFSVFSPVVATVRRPLILI